MERRPEKLITCLDVATRKERSLCRHAGEVVDAIVVALIFNRAAMKKTISLCPLTITGEEEEINPHHQRKTWHRETLTLRSQSTRNLLKTMDLYSLRPPA